MSITEGILTLFKVNFPNRNSQMNSHFDESYLLFEEP